MDAAELVEVDYDPLPAVVDIEAALADGAPLQFPELGTNLAAGVRDPAGADPLAGAEVVVRARMVNQRLAVVPMEGNAIACNPGPTATARADDLGLHPDAARLPRPARRALRARRGRVRVIAPHVGGAFGGKAGLAEHTVAIAAARRSAAR